MDAFLAGIVIKDTAANDPIFRKVPLLFLEGTSVIVCPLLCKRKRRFLPQDGMPIKNADFFEF